MQVASLEGGHDLGLLRRFHAAVDQSDGQARQGLAKRLPGGFGGLRLQLFGFLDQGADPVGLSALGAAGAHALNHLGAAAVGDQHGIDRRTPWRQLIQHRGVQIGVGAHCQGARNRRGGHDQLVRRHATRCALVAQGQALLHAKAVLLVDDGQPEIAKLYVILKQRVGADNHGGLAGGDQLQLVGALLALELARYPGHRQPQGTEPALEVVEVLLGQNLGWRHQRYLPTRLDGL